MHTLLGKSVPVPVVPAFQEYTFQLDIARRLVLMLQDWWVASVVSKGNGAIRASRKEEYGVQVNATNVGAMTKSMGQLFGNGLSKQPLVHMVRPLPSQSGFSVALSERLPGKMVYLGSHVGKHREVLVLPMLRGHMNS